MKDFKTELELTPWDWKRVDVHWWHPETHAISFHPNVSYAAIQFYGEDVLLNLEFFLSWAVMRAP